MCNQGKSLSNFKSNCGSRKAQKSSFCLTYNLFITKKQFTNDFCQIFFITEFRKCSYVCCRPCYFIVKFHISYVKHRHFTRSTLQCDGDVLAVLLSSDAIPMATLYIQLVLFSHLSLTCITLVSDLFHACCNHVAIVGKLPTVL